MHQLDIEIKEIATKLSSIDKTVAVLEYKLSSIEERLNKDEALLQEVEQRKISYYISRYWDKLPQMFVIAFGIMWLANWLYDLPATTQSTQTKSPIPLTKL